MNGAYRSLARVYDRLNREVDYNRWADFYEACFDRFLPSRPEILLDLACGTGLLTEIMSGRGYDMIGVDGSDEMLSEAVSRRSSPSNPLYLLQDMREFELYGSVGGVICSLDGINYLTAEGDLERCFACVSNYLDDGGIFIFDVNTPYKFENIFGNNAYILEDEDGGVFCGWQNFYDPNTRLCDFCLTVFERKKDGSYQRSDEEQQERCYTLDELRAALGTSGLEFLGVWGDCDFGKPASDCERWFIAARRVPR